jgi:hypothetical protein
MTTFDDREKAQEKKFALDQEQLFRAHARRDKLFGLWAAGEMGLSGAAAEAYAKGIVSEDIAHPGDKGIAKKVAGDLAAKGIKHALPALEAKLESFLAPAKQQIAAEAQR